MQDEQATQTETPDEKRKRLGRERTRKHRAGKKEPVEITDFSQIAEIWVQNEKQLDTALRERLLARHDEVMELEAEAAEVEKGVNRGLRAETLSALTPDPSKIFPMPDVSFRDIKKDTIEQGTTNYRQIEADSIKGNPLDEFGDYYRRYGFRLRIQSDVLQQARELLVLYALRTHDQALDWQTVEAAIDDCIAYRGFSPNADELRKLIREHRAPQAPVAEAPIAV